MSDEEQRRQERAAQDDAMAAGRLARMRARLGRDGPGLLPILVREGGFSRLSPDGDMLRGPPHSTVEVRAWAIKDARSVILDEDVQIGNDSIPRGTLYPVRNGTFCRVPAWFLDGGAPS